MAGPPDTITISSTCASKGRWRLSSGGGEDTWPQRATDIRLQIHYTRPTNSQLPIHDTSLDQQNPSPRPEKTISAGHTAKLHRHS
ncbi:hypothetical protein HPP92_028826 [Vanilla planifolia]|uniref:Uncharacterized protein n=1 Tax=Vanilla planifolia TaxID=51239 RepID=A0A835P734_VANPL|nr:hypothetical protein HPP92_028826 [Vanilla planifolia]KAG0446462.1 hypothetical protein HPP92_028815 [Vanilla planifolia]